MLIIVKSNKPTRIMDSSLCRLNKKVLLDYLVPTRLKKIEKLANAVTKALDDHSLALSVNLCLEELITNTILHGLRGATNRFIHVQISASDEWLEILLKYDAPQFDPFTQAPKLILYLGINERPIGGLGVHMVKKLMDDVHAYYDDTGNLIVLLKSLQQKTAE